jgi:imidazolonepropionase-like amidohydrolase
MGAQLPQAPATRQLPRPSLRDRTGHPPSSFFKAENTGRIEKGMAADVVVLDADPAMDVRNLSKGAYTIRSGTIIYSGAEKK